MRIAVDPDRALLLPRWKIKLLVSMQALARLIAVLARPETRGTAFFGLLVFGLVGLAVFRRASTPAAKPELGPNPAPAVALAATALPAFALPTPIASLQPALDPVTPDTPAAMPTAVLVPLLRTDVPAAAPATAPPSPAPDPLRFVFPTPGPAPVSAWRPPLYPVPWAPSPYDHFFFTRPIAADEVNWPLADYRYGGVFFPGVVHTGVDIPAPTGAPVLAAGPGKVIWAGYGLYALEEDPNDPYGLAVAIKHDFGYQGNTLYTVYGHMSEIFVARGQRLNGGDLIGLVGETGKVTGPHLHFEVRLTKNNFYGSRNPELWLSPPQGWGVLAARVMSSRGVPLERQPVKVHNLDTRQSWEVITYGAGSTNSDPYYRENVVIGDLPAGNYEIWIPYEGTTYDLDLTIHPGLVTYFTFRGREGFRTELPQPPDQFIPPDATAAPTP